MNSKRIAFGIGMALLVMAVFAVPAAANSTARFDPQHGSGNTSEWVKVVYYVDIEAGENLAVSQQTIKFDPEIISVGLVCVEHDCGTTTPTGAGQYCWGAFDHNDTYLPNGYSWSFNGDPRISEWQGPPYNKWVWKSLIGEGFDHTNTDGTIEIATYWVQPLTGDMPGVSPFNFDFERFPSGCPICQENAIGNWTPTILPVNWNHGTFTHIGPTETFTKGLVLGWNMISLPLTPEDSSTGAVLSSMAGKYNAVYNYNATAKEFEDATTDTMDPGIGYFVNVTTAGTWTYNGAAYNSMSVDLKQGLNLVGWLNTNADLPDAFDSIAGDYNYVAQWDATLPGYEVYDANAPPGVPEFIDFETMQSGNGYWIAAKEDCTLTAS